MDKFGWQRVYQGGLRVFRPSTCRCRWQPTPRSPGTQRGSTNVARLRLNGCATKRRQTMVRCRRRSSRSNPTRGFVRAMTGGRNFEQSLQPRGAGQAATGLGVQTVRLRGGAGSWLRPVDHHPEPQRSHPDAQKGRGRPRRAPTSDAMSLREGLRMSSNRAAVHLLGDVGIPKTVACAKAMGVGDVLSDASLALGSGEVTLQSLAAAYAAFANHGVVPKPILIRRVEDRDGTVLIFERRREGHARYQRRDGFPHGEHDGRRHQRGHGGPRTNASRCRRLAETGTSNDYNDAWFVGFTASLVAGVWVGFDQPHTILPGGFAAEVAVPLWTSFMKTATQGDKPRWLPTPRGVVSARVCSKSGKLASEGCEHADVIDETGHLVQRSTVYTEYFAAGTQPTETCTLHPSHGIFGAIATAIGNAIEGRPSASQAATRVNSTQAMPAPAGVDSGSSGDTQAPDTGKKKRGFWSRVFGVGRDEK